MTYCIKYRKRILDEISRGMTLAEAARKYNLSTTTIKNWVEHKEHYLNPFYNGRRQFSDSERLAMVQQVERGEGSIREVAKANSITYNCLKKWVRDKDHILAVYLTQERFLPADAPGDFPMEEQQAMAVSKNNKSPDADVKSLKEENEYLKAKVAYLEKLMELSGIPAPTVKKKSDTGPSGSSGKKAGGP